MRAGVPPTVRGGPRVRSGELSGSAALRLYHGVVEGHEVHVRGSDPTYGRGVDTRLEVDLG